MNDNESFAMALASEISDSIAIVGFSGEPERMVRMQSARNRLRIAQNIGRLTAQGGTAIFPALDLAFQDLLATSARVKHVILLTDGYHNENSLRPQDAVELAVALKMRVYTIGVVDPGGGGVDEELMTQMAQRTGGRYFKAATREQLTDVYKEISELETSAIGREHFQKFTELGPWFAIPAAALIGLELLLRATWLRRTPA